jgi:hypothetical protein
MSRPHAGQPPGAATAQTELTDIAIHLLEFQQRLNAFDSLYNEEVGGLTRDLARLKAEFLQRLQAQSAPEPRDRRDRRDRRSRPGASSPKAPRPGPYIAPAQEEHGDEQANAQ